MELRGRIHRIPCSAITQMMLYIRSVDGSFVVEVCMYIGHLMELHGIRQVID